MRAIAACVAFALVAGAQWEDISGPRIRAHVKFLSLDALEGRGVGVRADTLTTEYLAAQFTLVGAKPAGDDGTYFQRVPLTGVTTDPSATLAFAGKGSKIDAKWLDGFVGAGRTQNEREAIDAEAVFVGHGITAPEFGWTDYEGVDVKGKVVVLFTNEPPSEDPKFFGGKALTYYGRWTYKYEEAARQGAVAAIIVHTDATAGYGWEVVRNSWSGEDLQVKNAPGTHNLKLAGWVTQETGQKIAAAAGKSVDELLKSADTKGFKPFSLGMTVKASIPSKVRQVETRNVIAKVEGSDPKLAGEAVIFSAHWDHLGIGSQSGDNIHNGAVDNATGCGMLVEMARAWATMKQKSRRTALFLAVTAEEGGLRGSEYYATHPVVPAGKTAFALNFDAFYPFGRTKDVVLTGAERTTAWPVVQQVAKRFNLTIQPDRQPEQGFYYRSDHFSFAKVGIPAFSIEEGEQFEGKPAGYGEQIFKEYNSKNYHRPSDEYRDDWDFSGMVQMAKFSLEVALAIANQNSLPTWQPNDEFLPARQQSLK